MQIYTKILLGMAVGVVLGLAVGPSSALLARDGVRLTAGATLRVAPAADAARAPLSSGIRTARIVERRPGAEATPEWLAVEWTLTTGDVLRFDRDRDKRQREALEAGDPARAEAIGAEPRAEPDEAHRGWVVLASPQVSTYARLGQRLVDATEWLGTLFLALIKMVVVPLVFFSLTVGVASLGDLRRLGRLGGRTLVAFLATTVIAIVIGVGLANLVRPGELLSPEDRAQLSASYEAAAGSTVEAAADAPSVADQLVAIVPANPVASLAQGDMLQIIFFAVIFGVALTLLDTRRSQPIVSLCDHLNEAMVMLVHIAMKLAPFGVAALLFKVVGTTGLSVLLALGVYALVVVGGLLLHLVFTYGALVKIGARLPFGRFLAAIRPAMMLAFSTSSSSATLPVTKECVEDNLNVSSPVASFVIPLGATVNMDGTALYQGVAAIFIAQIYGMDLTFGDQATIVVSATLASVGAAGVPGAGLITLAMVLTAIGVPTEGLALILGVDRLLDMFRTTINVVGDCCVAVLIARAEGDDLRFLTPEQDARDSDRGFEGRLDHVHPVRPDGVDSDPSPDAARDRDDDEA